MLNFELKQRICGCSRQLILGSNERHISQQTFHESTFGLFHYITIWLADCKFLQKFLTWDAYR